MLNKIFLFPKGFSFFKRKGFLRYLKTIRVIAAVYRGLAPLKRSLTHRHWADLTSCTQDFSLAAGYVFVKQSGPPCHCDLRFLNKLRSTGILPTKDTGLNCRIP